jgi:hypothetical protein
MGGSGGTGAASGGAGAASSGSAGEGGSAGTADGAGGMAGTGGLAGATSAAGGGSGECLRRGGTISDTPSCEALVPILLESIRVRTAQEGFVNAGFTSAIDVVVVETAGYDSIEGVVRIDFGGANVGYTGGDVRIFAAACSRSAIGFSVVFPSTLTSGTVVTITAKVHLPDAECHNTSVATTSVTVR